MKTLARKEWIGATILWRQLVRAPFLFGLFSRRIVSGGVNQSTVLDVADTAIRIRTNTIFGPGIQWISLSDIEISEALPGEPEEPSWT